MILLLIKVLHFYFLMKVNQHSLFSSSNHARKKKNFYEMFQDQEEYLKIPGKDCVFVILNLSTPVLDERVIMSSICLATMNDDSNKFILDLRCIDRYIRDI